MSASDPLQPRIGLQLVFLISCIAVTRCSSDDLTLSRDSSGDFLLAESEETGPEWQFEPPNEATFSNSTGLRLDCIAEGLPRPVVEWVQEDQVITHNLHGLRTVLNNGSLYFPPFRGDHFRDDLHRASYHCRARNRLGTIFSRSVRVKAVVDEDFSLSVSDATAINGNSAVLRCNISPSHVRPYVVVTSWLHEEGTAVEIFPEDTPRGKYTVLPSGTLLVHHASTFDSYKTYTCKAEHVLTGLRKRSPTPARLMLTEPTTTMYPAMIEPGEGVKRLKETKWVGDGILLPCVSQGVPVPESTWFRMESGSLRQVLPSSRILYHLEVLIIHQLLVEDSGVYVCITNNTLGSHRVEIELLVQSPLETRVEPAAQTVDLNKAAIFRCTVLGHPVKEISWYKNGRQLHMGHRYHTSLNATLKIYSVQEGDEGSYQCVARNENDAGLSTGYLWLGDAQPVLLYKFSEQTLQPGPAVSLRCIAKGNPTPKIQWLLDGFSIPESDRFLVGQYVTIHDDVISHVNISNVQAIDGGTYACVAENTVGQAVHQARLNVYGSPRIRPMPSVKAIESGVISVTCPVSGYPIQSIVWKKDGYELPSDGRQKVYPNGTLMISSAVKATDEGYYTCTATNRREETDSGNVHIQVMTPPTIMPFLFPNNLLNEGMRSAVSCQILEGNLPITFVWDKNGDEIPMSSRRQQQELYQVSIRSNDEYSSTLVIDHLEFHHRGNYTCTATNVAGSSKHTAELVVNVPPKWVEEPMDVEAVEGQDILVPCRVDGYPKPTTKWTKDTGFGLPGYQMLPLTLEDHTLSNGSLLLPEASKRTEGLYTCTAKNGVRGSITKSINVTVNAPPRFEEKSVRLSVRKGAKANLVCEARGDEPLDLFWKRNGLPIREDEDARFTIVEHQAADESVSRFVIAPVLDQDVGQVTCEAANRFGREQKHFLIAIEDVPSSPSGVRLSSIESRSLEISWNAPHSGNSPILNYVIEYSNLPDRRDSGEVERRKMTAPGDALSLIIQNLRPGTRYKFRVSAENRHGVGTESQTVTAKMLDEAPASPPRNVEVIPKSSTELQITWDAPPFAHWNSEMLSYKIGYKEVGTTDGLDYLELHPSSDSSHVFSLHSLNRFTSYQVLIQASNAQGEGPPSTSVVATTLEDVPSGPPEDVRCEGLSHNAIHIEWSKPLRSNRNGIIRGYVIQYYPRTLWFESDGTLQTSETEGETLDIKGLETYTNYSISVSAFTRAGKGRTSAQVFCQTAEAVPSAPADIKAVTSSDNSVIVSWRAPDKPNGRIHKYTVFRREVVNGESVSVKESSVLSGPNYLELSALLPNRRYDLWVKAATSAGYGPSSVITSIIVGRTVRARVVSFGEVEAIPWRSFLVLDCLHVGEPTPSIQWEHNGGLIRENSKYQIFPNGSLSIHRLVENDQGDYTCKVENIHGRDQISYDIIIQIPSTTPEAIINNVTSSDLEVVWRSSRSRKQPILGFSINYRREHGEWHQVDCDPLSDSLWLGGLACGTNYSVYMTAYNHVGASLPSAVVGAKTVGRVPDVPNVGDFLIVNKTMVTIKLDAFRDGGCSILYYVIEYRRDIQPKFTLVANNVSPRDKIYAIRGLEPAARYYIKVTAHNTAGSSIAEYPFSTLTSFGATLPPPRSTSREQESTTSTLLLAVKILSILFILGSLVAASFYGTLYIRKWKQKRDLSLTLERRPFNPRSHSPTPLGDTNMTTSSSTTSTAKNVLDHLKQPHREEQSPMLPPNTFRATSTDLLLAATPTPAGIFVQPQAQAAELVAWTAEQDVCPYATFQVPKEQQVTLKLAPVAVDQFGTLCHAGKIVTAEPSFQSFAPLRATDDMMLRPTMGTELFQTLPSREPMYATLIRARKETAPSREELTNDDGKKLISLQVADTKYDSDSDFDYRNRPPRPHFRSRRRGRRRESDSSSSSDNSISPLPRVRSIEALEFQMKNKAKGKHTWKDQWRKSQETHFIRLGSSQILPPASFSTASTGGTGGVCGSGGVGGNSACLSVRPGQAPNTDRPKTKRVHHQIHV